jgi:predicted nucleic acid-binding protein
MTYLLDVSTLLAWLWSDHEFHRRVMAWQRGKTVATCPLTELGFLRISSQPAFGATLEEARELLAAWHQRVKPEPVPCDLAVLESQRAPVSSKTTDFYLASLAEKRGMAWATLDEGVTHRAAFVVPR